MVEFLVLLQIGSCCNGGVEGKGGKVGC
jgi:hypothetical protein